MTTPFIIYTLGWCLACLYAIYLVGGKSTMNVPVLFRNEDIDTKVLLGYPINFENFHEISGIGEV